MDWWTGMNSCGPGSQMGDQIEIFDPWINCDDLDLGTILHQASSRSNNNNTTNRTSTTTTSSGGSSAAASSSPPSLPSAPSGTVAAFATATNDVPDDSGSSIHQNNNSTDSQSTSHQNVSFVVGVGQSGQSNGISLIEQQQHLHHQDHSHQQQLPSNNKQNIFNIIGNVAVANAISSHNHNQMGQHHHHPSQQHNQHLNQQQQLVSGSRNHAPQTSISSSQCSSISSTGSGSLSSVESSPVSTNSNHHHHHRHQQQQQQHHLQLNNNNQNQAANMNMDSSLYLSNSSLNSSSPILVPMTTANLPLMADSNHSNNLLLHHQNNNVGDCNNNNSKYQSLLDQHSGYSSQQQHQQQHHHYMQQQQQANLYHHQIMVASGNGGTASASSSSASPFSSSSSLSTSSTSSEQVRSVTNDQGQDDSKRNLKHLLHLASSDIDAHTVSLVAASDCRPYYNAEVVNSRETTDDSPFPTTLAIDSQNHNHDQLSIVRSALASVKYLTTNTANLVTQSNISANSSSTTNYNNNSSLQTTSDQQQYNGRSTISGTKTGRSDATSYLAASCSSLSLVANNGINAKTSNVGKQQATVQKVRRCRHITDYVLAEEEKRLLMKEGYSDFPMTCQSRPLSKAEEKILRKIRRKIRNKKSAQCSRQRKKEYVEDLERKYKAVIRENEELKQVLNRIQQQQQPELRIC